MISSMNHYISHLVDAGFLAEKGMENKSPSKKKKTTALMVFR